MCWDERLGPQDRWRFNIRFEANLKSMVEEPVTCSTCLEIFLKTDSKAGDR